jgi:tripartite-type tricarboxylate transporter receptor subunit TctC
VLKALPPGFNEVGRQLFRYGIFMRRVALLVYLAFTPAAPAQTGDFPSHTVTIVSPYQAGGTNDLIARVLAQKLQERWGKPVIVENKPGANGGIGVNAVVSAAPDGYTLLAVASSALTLNPLFYSNLSYEPMRDLAPVTRTGVVANVLVVNPSLPARDVKSLIALAKEKPGSLTYASQGIGSNGHITGEFFKQRAQVDILHVPYKGSAPAVQDLLANNVQIMFDNLPSVLPLVRAGALRALAVTMAERSPELPEVPTMAEAALPGFDTSAWFALLAPKSTPALVIQDIESAAVAALKAPETQERLRAAGVGVAADGSIELLNRVKLETAMWREVIGKAGIKAE